MEQDSRPLTYGDLKRELGREIGGLKTELDQRLSTEIGGLKAGFDQRLSTEISGLKTESDQHLSTEIGRLRSEMDRRFTSVEADISGLRAGVNRIAADQVSTRVEMAQIKSEMMTKADKEQLVRLITELGEKADSYARKFLTHPNIMNDHETRLLDHERRISALEAPPGSSS